MAFIEITAHFGCVYLTINQIANYEGIVNKYEHPPNTLRYWTLFGKVGNYRVFDVHVYLSLSCVYVFPTYIGVDDNDDDDDDGGGDGIGTMNTKRGMEQRQSLLMRLTRINSYNRLSDFDSDTQSAHIKLEIQMKAMPRTTKIYIRHWKKREQNVFFVPVCTTFTFKQVQ